MTIRNKFSRVQQRAMEGGTVRTKQSFKKDCDINVIMGKYAKGQVVDHLAKYQGNFGDVPAGDFQEAMNICAKAQEMFSDLPSEVRARFANSPFEFLSFAQDPKNLDELRLMKLAKPKPEPQPTPLQARVSALELDQEARLELARKALKAPPHTES